MKRDHFISLLDGLRTQLRDDDDIPEQRFATQLVKANVFLREIATAQAQIAEIHRTLPMLRQSVQIYYTGIHSRSLSRHFVLHDLQVLQDAFVEDEIPVSGKNAITG